MKTEAIKKTYNGRCVLDIDGLELAPGKIYAVLGANGSGKTTLARILAGTEKPDDGLKCICNDIGFLPQKTYAFAMTVRKNLNINGGERADELIEKLALTGLERTNAKKLSGGETARMALARLLQRDYKLLILDEPTAAMDVRSTLLAEQVICDYRDRTNCAVMLITHSASQAKRIADEVIFVSDGKIAESGSASDVISSPSSKQFADFLNFCRVDAV